MTKPRMMCCVVRADSSDDPSTDVFGGNISWRGVPDKERPGNVVMRWSRDHIHECPMDIRRWIIETGSEMYGSRSGAFIAPPTPWPQGGCPRAGGVQPPGWGGERARTGDRDSVFPGKLAGHPMQQIQCWRQIGSRGQAAARCFPACETGFTSESAPAAKDRRRARRSAIRNVRCAVVRRSSSTGPLCSACGVSVD